MFFTRKIYNFILTALLFNVVISNAQIQNLFENFNNSSGIPIGWSAFDNGLGKPEIDWHTISGTNAYQGSSMALDIQSTLSAVNCEEYLVTPLIKISNNSKLVFNTKSFFDGNQNTTYSIRISNTDQNNPLSFTTIQSWNEFHLDGNTGNYTQKIVSLDAFVGQDVYIAFVRTNENGDRWLIDDVSITNCNIPVAATISQNPYEDISVSVASLFSPNNNIDYTVELFDASSDTLIHSFPLNHSGLLTITNNYLNYNTSYYVKVYSNCLTNGVVTSNTLLHLPNNYGGCYSNFRTEAHNNHIGLKWKNIREYDNATLEITDVLGNVQNINLNNYIVYNDPDLPSDINSGTIVKWRHYMSPIIITSNSFFKFKVNGVVLQESYVPYMDINTYFSANEVFCNQDPPIQLQYNNDDPNHEHSNWNAYDNLLNNQYLENELNLSSLTASNSIIYKYDNGNTCDKIIIRKSFLVQDCETCIFSNPNYNFIKSKFIDLLNHLVSYSENNTIPNIYECSELELLTPFINFTNPKIYNFTRYIDSEDGINIRFNLTPNLTNEFDVELRLLDHNITPYSNLVQITDIFFPKYLENDYSIFIPKYGGSILHNNKASYKVRGINFCDNGTLPCTTTNPYSIEINKLFVNLIKKLVVKKIGGVYNGVTYPGGLTDAQIINEASLYPEFIYLKPYITDANPLISNFTTTFNSYNQLTSIQFSFSNSHEFDIRLGGLNFTALLNTTNFLFDLSSFINSETPIRYDSSTMSNIFIKEGFIKHINFCPDNLYCAKHIALVLDESGSLKGDDYQSIKAQLTAFINAQADGNSNSGTNTVVSLIGLSDSDTDTRTASPFTNTSADNGYHIIGTERLLPSNKINYLKWINSYGNRSYKSQTDGISKNSDYWKSGLQKALDIKADQVILITDGCQTANVQGLKATLSNFTNHNTISNNYKPHLYIIGKNSGYYVDESFATNKSNPMEVDPNDAFENEKKIAENILLEQNDIVENDLNVEEELKTDINSNIANEININTSNNDYLNRSASNLLLSLKYLYNLNLTTDVLNSKYDFNKDCYAADDFLFMVHPREKDYLYNYLIQSTYTCSDKIPVNVCDNCVGFQPLPGEDYIISAWVKQERNDQVINYKPSISGQYLGVKIMFFKVNEDGSANETYSDTYLTPIDCEIKQDEMIEGWQRIFKKFKMPNPNYPYEIRIVLVNEDDSKPLFFDDIRIHPIDSNMKSFVYDAESYKLLVELDENNYSTFYEYDKEGGLIRVKKETSKGIKTIQETRQSNVLKEN